METVTLDETDRRIVHALQLDGRAPFSRIAAVLGLSERTVGRRYQRLRSRLALRVVGIVDSRRVGQLDWFARILPTPTSHDAVRLALARRDDTSWIASLVGTTELTCVVRTPADSLPVLDQLSRSRHIQMLTAQCLLRPVAGVGGWAGRLNALTPREQAELASAEVGGDPPGPYAEREHHIVQLLAGDARASVAYLSTRTGLSESTVRRTIAELSERRVLRFEIDIDPALYGRPTEAICWLDVRPGDLAAVGRSLATHPEVAFAATTTGRTNMLAILALPDAAGLHDYLSARLGSVAGINRLETALTGRRVKRAGPLTP